MTPQPLTPYHIISGLPAGAAVTFNKVSWEEYEKLLEQVGEPAGLRLSYFQGELTAMTVSAEHEKYTRFIEQMVTALKLRLRINISSFGSATMKKSKKLTGKEPDACFYVQSVALIGNRIDLDFAIDPPPDIAVEVDIHHSASNKFDIYAALNVAEVWVFDGQQLTIHLLEQNKYIDAPLSRALPVLTAEVLTRFLLQMRVDGEFQTLLAFDEWLQTLA